MWTANNNDRHRHNGWCRAPHHPKGIRGKKISPTTLSSSGNTLKMMAVEKTLAKHAN